MIPTGLQGDPPLSIHLSLMVRSTVQKANQHPHKKWVTQIKIANWWWKNKNRTKLNIINSYFELFFKPNQTENIYSNSYLLFY